MAKGKYGEWRTEEGLIVLKGWAQDGLTDELIAQKIGISCSTLYAWKDRFPEIAEALKKGKEVVDYQVQNALLAKALAGDTTAQIFWLKNRRPDKWRDKVEVKGAKEQDNNLFKQIMVSVQALDGEEGGVPEIQQEADDFPTLVENEKISDA